MIQAPLPANYAQAPVQYAPQQPAAPQIPGPEYNAIKINIVEPKVNAPGSQAASPYNYPQAPVYNYPQATQAPVYYPPTQTQAPVYTQPAQPAVTVPAPQVINQQTVNQVPPSVVPQQAQAPEQQAPVVPPAAPQQTAQPSTTIDVAGLAAKVKSDNLEEAGATIEEIADIAQSKPDQAPQLLDTSLMEALLGVIGKDTESLEGPSEKQKQLRQQVMEGKQLSEPDMAEANKITPKEMAARNKQYALFTTAIMQNALIDEFKKTNNMTPDIKDLPGMDQIVKTVKDNANPMLRASALAALAYNARPEYKSVMKEIFELSKQDADENVQKVAAEGLAKLEQIQDTKTAAPAQAA